jgi:hypothetical protein
MENPEFKNIPVENIDLNKLEEKLRIFLVEILKVSIDRGDIYHTIFSLDPDKRTRFHQSDRFTDAEKEYINKNIS